MRSAATRRLFKEYSGAEGFPSLYVKYHRDTLLEPAYARGFGVEQGRKVSDLQLLAKLQHLGAATGLLDFTWSPLVALWFASQDPKCDGQLFIVNTNNTTEIDLIASDEKKQDIETVFSRTDNSSPHLLYWEPMLSGDATSRILRQRSLFIIGRPLIPEDNEKIAKQISIAKDDKKLLRKDLELLDVTEASLFQDIYGFSKAQSSGLPLQEIRDPNDYFLQANQFYQQGDYPKAIAAYSKCIEREPDVCETYFLRGNAAAASGDQKKAIEDYDKAVFHKNRPSLGTDPATTRVIFNPILFMVYFNRGNAKSVLEDYEGALADYMKAIECERAGNDQELRFNLANTYADLHKFEEAIAEYNKVAAHDLPRINFNKGNALAVLGRFNEALRCYKDSALEGMDKTKVDQNLYTVGRIIDRTRDREYLIHSEASGTSGRPTISVTIVGDHSDPESPLMVGNVGNSGNFGGPGLSGGKGLSGKLPLIFHLLGRKDDEG